MQKVKVFQGSMPLDPPSLSCAKHTDITSPSHSPTISHFAFPLAKNLKETLTYIINFFHFRNALDFLCNEGHIYSTIDDEHYKSTEDYF